MKVRLMVILTILWVWSSSVYCQNENIVLKTDLKGEVIFGSIENLITQIRNGKSVRVGWQHDLNKDSIPDLEHWIDAKFISILNGHVFNQIEPIYRQSPKMSIPQIQIIESNMMWTGIIGTNGKLLSRHVISDIERIEDENIYKAMKKQCQIRELIVSTIWVIKEE